ncbi:phosphoribosylformylglycinamidine synthase subunit PurL [bacterium]|nr:phosphoribosylformylglycinamidine synthase subunit PurL [bacterium]
MTNEVIEQHGLTTEEYASIVKSIGREPNLVELGIFSVMWSEHCSYKSSRIYLKNFPTKGEVVVQGPGENAGVIDLGDDLCCAFKMESHNHPSFIEPYQGAATGVGGILRDVFTMGARPIANLNSLRFGEASHEKIPFLVKGVVAGIAGYGNCMGIPTVGGEVYFDPCYNGNNLVNAMTVGLVQRDKIFKGYASGPGNPIIYLGSKTGRDGIHGATMASDSFDEGSEEKRPTVQVGDPFTEKRLLEACLELMAKDAIIGIQDMGAAGFTSSSIEMASRAGTGIEMDLNKVPLREKGMTPYEIMLSESQERMLLVAKKGAEKIVEEIFTKWDLDACVVGHVTDSGRIVCKFNNEVVIDLPIDPLAHGAPIYERPVAEPKNLKERQTLDVASIPQPSSYNEALLKMLANPTIASKHWIYEQYDHQVMTNTVVKPGSDAAVIRLKGTNKALAVTTNVNSRYCYQDPVTGGKQAVAESGRNIVCSGGRPLAITDCLNFGNPENPEIMWEFRECVKGISEACLSLNTPVVSGNVSFYNETKGTSIYPTPTIGMVGLIDDITTTVDQFYKNEGDIIILLGETREELGASEYLWMTQKKVAGLTPRVDLNTEKKLWALMNQLTNARLVQSAHDCSEGGLAVTLAESALGPKSYGILTDLNLALRDDVALFSETQSRIVLSVKPASLQKVLDLSREAGVVACQIGKVTGQKIVIKNKDKVLVDVDLSQVKDNYINGFERAVFKR